METYKIIVYIIGIGVIIYGLSIIVEGVFKHYKYKRLMRQVELQTKRRKYTKRYYCED